MSHNVLIANVKITSLAALRRAISELNAEGIRVSLEERTTFRTYQGQSNKCDLCISLPDQRFDIGLLKQADGSYAPYFDASMFPRNGVGLSCSLERSEFGPGNWERSAIGKLSQRYTTCAAEEALALQGLTAVREVNENGDIILTAETY